MMPNGDYIFTSIATSSEHTAPVFFGVPAASGRETLAIYEAGVG